MVKTRSTTSSEPTTEQTESTESSERTATTSSEDNESSQMEVQATDVPVPAPETAEPVNNVPVSSGAHEPADNRAMLLQAKARFYELQAQTATLQAQTATAELAMLKLLKHEEVNRVPQDGAPSHRINTWLQDSQMLAITERPHVSPTQPDSVTNREAAETIPSTLPVIMEESTDVRIHPSEESIPTPPQRQTAMTERQDLSDFTKALTRAIMAGQSSHKAVTELPFFNGAYQEWLTFRAAYSESESNYSDIENTARLRRCLKGKAREAVERMLFNNTPPTNIIRQLELRFGRPDTIARNELDRLRSLSRPTDAPRDLCIFANHLANIVATLQSLNKIYYLYNPEITKITIDKLTPTLRYRWFEFSAAQQEEEADLIKLNKFLDREAELCGPYAQPEEINSATTTVSKRPQRTFATSEKNKMICPICKENEHNVFKCQKFLKADNESRWNMAKLHKLCFQCLRVRKQDHVCHIKACDVKDCNKRHNRLLHKFVEKESVASTWNQKRSQSYLKIATVRVSGPAGVVEAQALLDDGSTVTLIDSDLAKRVGARGPINPLRIEAIADTKLSASKSRCVALTLQGSTQKHRIRAHTIERLRLSPQAVTAKDLSDCEHLIDIKDRLQYNSVKPQILIGQDNWQLLIATDMRKGKQNQPVASLTPLGWVLHGARTRTLGQRVNFVHHLNFEESPFEGHNVNEQLRQFFAIESLTVTPKLPMSDPSRRALNILNDSTMENNGRYQTGLLWKSDDIKLPNNYDNALSRLSSTEKKIDKNPQLRQKYEKQMEELIEKGYAEIAPLHKNPQRTWYLPHFAVINPLKPEKIRIVHDAAAKTSGVSLNDNLLTGPDLLQSLPGVLMRFRQHKIAVTADIAEMFMQVKIRPEDRDALRYLWRGNKREGTPQEYRMTSLIFGATCSPSAAIYVKNLNASKFKNTHPDAVSAIINNHYVDDYLDSFQTTDEAIKVASQVRDIHHHGCFQLRQWSSNSEIVMKQLDTETEQRASINLSDGATTERVLGLIWKPCTDTFAFNLDMARLPKTVIDNASPTKREALKIVMSLFDPLGLASPVTIRAKQILQEVWRRGIDWDQPLDPDLSEQWKTWMIHLKELRDVTIPRCYLNYSTAATLQLHVFVDASELACSAALYWRATTPDGTVQLSLILAKSRVAPLKLTSIPRLELQAAVMGSRMAATVIEEHYTKPESKTFWTDSQTVLTWLKTGSRSYKPFVAHRVAAIEENTTINEWRWVPTKLNVADDATRDVPKDFNSNHRWFQGPSFLCDIPELWPRQKKLDSIDNTGEEKVNFIVPSEPTVTISHCVPDSTKFSRWERLHRATARVLQFIEICKNSTEKTHYSRTKKHRDKDPDWRRQDKPINKFKKKSTTTPTDKFIVIPTRLLREAEILLIRVSQQESFSTEIEDLTNNKTVASGSRIHSLSVTLTDSVIRLNTRIGATRDICYEQLNPPVLDGNQHIVKLMIEFIHRQLHHAGVETTVNECRQTYWIIRLRTTVRNIVSKCIPCRIRRNIPSQPATGDHPLCRLAHHCRPFTYTGVDYFGPLTVTVGRSTQKRYVALFTCLTTRAVHLEIAASLSADSAIMALRRMIARRGCPTEIWSDNGTNFKAADKELRQAIDQETEREATKRMITWRYIPPGAPFMGGAWERLVRSVKTSLYAILHERHPQEEVLSTLLSEVEFTVNSRPLTHVSLDSQVPEALTPNHFLLSGPARVPVPGTFDEHDLISRSRWRASQHLADQFWTRWLREYLPELQYRREPHNKGPLPQEGNVVLIVDNSLPRNVWPKGVVIKTYPGTDGITRTVDVKTTGGILRRATKKLVILPTDSPAPSISNDLKDDGGGRMCRTKMNYVSTTL